VLEELISSVRSAEAVAFKYHGAVKTPKPGKFVDYEDGGDGEWVQVKSTRE